MYKGNVRSFAFGILFSVSLIGTSFFIFEEKPDTTIQEAKAILKEEGFITLSKEEYENLEKKNTEKTAEVEEKAEKVKQEDEPPTEEEETEKDDTPFQLEIVSGMNTEEISSILEVANIIEDKNDFEQFLIDHDFNTKVQVGVFELNNSMGYEEIAKTITKNK